MTNPPTNPGDSESTTLFPVLTLNDARQKLHDNLGSTLLVSSFGGKTLALRRGILQDGHPDAKQYVFPWTFKIETAFFRGKG